MGGVEWSGVEWSGVEWSGVEWGGVECSGVGGSTTQSGMRQQFTLCKTKNECLCFAQLPLLVVASRSG